MGFAAEKDDPSLEGKNLSLPARSLDNVDKAGTLARQSSFLKVWKDRHVVITKDSLMYWYNSPTSSSPEEVIALKKATGVRREEVAGRSYTFIVTMKGVVYPFSAATAEEMESWIRVIGKAIVRSSTVEWDDTSDRLDELQAPAAAPAPSPAAKP